jgi:2-polyprenyl-3-methyl-5-hydroxy-6-metoxy-1,4-benzoquinol methylase
MTQQFDAKKTQEYFDRQAVDFSEARVPRDEIFIDLILPEYKKENKEIAVLDFGCGGGKLLLDMLELGIKAQGIEKHNNICRLAKQRLREAGFDENKIIQGSMEELSQMPSASFDFIVLMGVFQYLSAEDYGRLLKIIHQLLKPGGHLVASFQNALFDIFTFNKYTVDFFKENFFRPLGLNELLGDELINDLKGLMAYPEKPDYSLAIARDNIYVRTTNPLTIADELKKYKFKLAEKYFYSFFLLPRLIEGKYKDKLKTMQEEFEVKRSREWYGYFMANAFVADCVKNGD